MDKDAAKLEKKEISTLETIEETENTAVKINVPVVAVAFSSTFTAVTTFFTSIIISKYNDFDPSINIPTLFLLMSTFGFLYATIVYANTISILAAGRYQKAKKSIRLGDLLSEYLGIYFLVLSIPLIIDVISKDPFLRIATLCVDLGGLYVYHASGFSIMERYYKKYNLLFVALIVVLELGLVLFQYKNTLVFEGVASILVLFMFGLAAFARNESV